MLCVLDAEKLFPNPSSLGSGTLGEGKESKNEVGVPGVCGGSANGLVKLGNCTPDEIPAGVGEV